MNKSESKYFHTAARMDEALLELLEQKDFAYITVKEICEKAGVNRSTFYLHYETVGELLSESVAYMNGQFRAYFNHNPGAFITKLRTCPMEELCLVTPEYLTPYLRYIQEHKRLFQAAVEHPAVLRADDTYERLFRHVFTPILERYQIPEQDRQYLMAFYIQGLIAVITEWLEQDCAAPIPQIISIMERCIARPGGLQELPSGAAGGLPRPDGMAAEICEKGLADR